MLLFFLAGKNFWSAAVTNTFLELYKQYTPLLSKHRVQSFYEVLSTKLEEATGVSVSSILHFAPGLEPITY